MLAGGLAHPGQLLSQRQFLQLRDHWQYTCWWLSVQQSGSASHRWVDSWVLSQQDLLELDEALVYAASSAVYVTVEASCCKGARSF